MRHPAFVAAAALAILFLAGCSGGDQADYNDAGQPSAKDRRAEAAIENAVAANGMAATVASGAPVVAPTPGVDRSRVLPAGFQGYWGRVPGDCDLANVGATGRLNIDGDAFRFYESKAEATAIERSTPDAVVATLAFSGEGQRWSRRTTLNLTAGGTRLVRTEDGGQPITYQRC